MSKGNVFENDWLKLIFNAAPIPNLADNAATAPLTSLYMSLHTADPGESGDQTTSEVAYPGYARVPVARSAGGWAVTANSVSPVANIDFPPASGGAAVATYGAIGTALSGTGKILYKGTVTPNITISSGVTPRLTTGSIVTED